MASRPDRTVIGRGHTTAGGDKSPQSLFILRKSIGPVCGSEHRETLIKLDSLPL